MDVMRELCTAPDDCSDGGELAVAKRCLETVLLDLIKRIFEIGCLGGRLAGIKRPTRIRQTYDNLCTNRRVLKYLNTEAVQVDVAAKYVLVAVGSEIECADDVQKKP